MINFLNLVGNEARKFSKELASLRMKVFWDFPYLYEGNLLYEEKYLETYFKTSNALIFLVLDEGRLVGATTGILAAEEEEPLRKPFEDYGLRANEVFYFGESILLPEYRGKGIGKKFFEVREDFARNIDQVKHLAFCAVERDPTHPLRPLGYEPLDRLWISRGFQKAEGLVTLYSWKDRDHDHETKKKMQYWLKSLKR